MPSWGIVATVKAPEEQVLAFIAHHLSLGASQIWLYFDDPDDPAYAAVSRLPHVKATRCTDWYWALRGGRDRRHQDRQIRNARHAQRKCRLDWLGHVDVDEFLAAPRPVEKILAEVPSEVVNVRMEAFEAMHDPALPDDIFTARQFRGSLQEGYEHLHQAVFGPMSALLSKGSLGHGLGKSFCRPARSGVRLDLHLVFQDQQLLKPRFHPELRVLHFHAQDFAAWRIGLPHRLEKGAYSHPIEQQLKAYLSGASDTALLDFYQTVMTLTPEKTDLLQAHGRLVTTDLRLRDKVKALRDGTLT